MSRGIAWCAGAAWLSADHHVDDRVLQDSAALESVAPGQSRRGGDIYDSSDYAGGVSPHRGTGRGQRDAPPHHRTSFIGGDGFPRARYVRRFLCRVPHHRDGMFASTLFSLLLLTFFFGA